MEARTPRLARTQPAGEELSQQTHIIQETNRETSRVTQGRRGRTEEARTEETSGQNQRNAAALQKKTLKTLRGDLRRGVGYRR